MALPFINYFTLSLFVGSLVAIGSGIFVIVANPKGRMYQSWFFLSLSSAVWSLGYLIMIVAPDKNIAWLANWTMHYAAIVIPLFYFSFIIYLTKTQDRYKRFLISFALLGLILLTLNQTKLFVRDVFSKFIFNFVPDAGPLYIYFTVYFFLIVVYASIIVWRSIKEATARNSFEEAQRLKIVILFTIAGFLGGGSVFFLTFNVPIPPYPIILFSLYPLINGYAIIRHHLFNIKLLSAEVFMFLLWVFILFRTILSETLNDRIYNTFLFIASVPLGLFIIRSIIREVKQKEENARLATNLEKANEKLKELDKEKTEFVSMASHQLRSPITAIRGYSSMLTDGSFGQINPEVTEAAKVINESSQRLLGTIEDFLDITRIELGTMKYNFSDVDVLDLVKKTVEELKPTAERKKIAVSVSSEPGKYIVNADSGKLSQVIGNLIDNALKYIPERKDGEVPGEIKIRVYNEPIQGTVRIAIADNGMGIGKETIPYLFKRFARSEDAAKVNIRGTGQGLFVAKQLLEAQKGRIWAESPGLGLGTTFYIELPAKQPVERN